MADNFAIIDRLGMKIEGRYDPENDTPVVGPRVTWAEYSLLEMVQALTVEVQRLRAELETVKRKSNKDGR